VLTEEQYESVNRGKMPDPFLRGETFITSGKGKAIICAVGKSA
jgi:hypothetical protein